MTRRRFRPEVTLFATLFVAAAGGVAWLAGELSSVWRAQRDFVAAPAIVLEAGLDEIVVPRPFGRISTRRLPHVFFAYQVGEREFEGRGIAPLWLPFVDSDAYQSEVIAGLSPLDETTVRYDPADPRRSYLTLEFDRYLVASWLAFLAGAAAASGGALFRALRDSPPPAGAPRLAALLCGLGLLGMAARHAGWGEVEPLLLLAGGSVLLFAAWPWLRGALRRPPPAVASA